MKFCLTLQLKEKYLPVEYRRAFLSYLKNALTKCNSGKYYEKFFKDTNPKDYCFDIILTNPKFTKDEVLLDSNEIKVIFSTSSKSKTGFILFSAFIAQKDKVYPLPNNNHMVLKSIHEEKQEKIVSSRAIFKTTLGGGICVREHDKETNKDRYYTYEDKEFREKIKVTITNQVLKAGFSQQEANDIQVNPIQCKKVVVKHYNRYIDVTTGMLEIQATKDILQHFYEVGVGSRRSMGFAMLNLITQDLV